MDSKKVLIVANTTWNIYNFRINVIKELLNNNCLVTVVAPRDEYISYLKKTPKAKHIHLENLSRKGISIIQDIRLTLNLYKIYKREKPDVILHYTIKPNIYGSIASQLLNIPTISAVTGLGYAFLHNGWLHTWVKFLYTFAFRKNKKILFENNDDRELFINENIITKEQGISLKGCGVDTTYYSPAVKIGTQSTVTFSFIGRLLYDKGILEFVKAAKLIKQKYPKTQFLVAGQLDTGNPAAVEKKELSTWIEEGIIQYEGFMKDVRSLINQSDCIVLPSYSEGSPRSLSEAMAMERPIITTNTPGCREAIEDGINGFCVKVKNIKSLYDGMEKFLKTSIDQRQKMGKAGRQKVLKEFDDKIIAQNIYNIINSVAK